MILRKATTMNATRSRHPALASRGQRAQHGMTLIEILVAIVVLSIGLLGLAGLQLKGLQVNQGSTYNWQAAMLAEDMADRIRADTAAAKAGYYLLPATTSASASVATVANLAEWQARVKSLPGGSATIAPTAGGAPGEMQIEVSWDDTRANNGTSTPTTTRAKFTLKSEMWN
jgi:type IV pilus assembly protein PilV